MPATDCCVMSRAPETPHKRLQKPKKRRLSTRNPRETPSSSCQRPAITSSPRKSSHHTRPETLAHVCRHATRREKPVKREHQEVNEQSKNTQERSRKACLAGVLEAFLSRSSTEMLGKPASQRRRTRSPCSGPKGSSRQREPTEDSQSNSRCTAPPASWRDETTPLIRLTILFQ